MFPSHLVRPKRSESETLLQTRLHRHKIYFRCQESPRDTLRIAVDLSEKNIDKWKKDGKKKTPCEEFSTVGEIFRLLAFWPWMFPTPPIPCRYLWHRFRAAPQADFPLSLLIPRKKKKKRSHHYH